MSKKLESWARADLVNEVLRLREKVTELEAKLEAKLAATPKQPDGATPGPGTSHISSLLSKMGVARAPSPKPPAPPVSRTPAPPKPSDWSEDSDGNAVLHGAYVKAETDRAILVEVDCEDVWVPKSQVHENSDDLHQGDEGRLVVRRWFAEKEGLL